LKALVRKIIYAFLSIYLFYFTASDDRPEPGMSSAGTSSNTKTL